MRAAASRPAASAKPATSGRQSVSSTGAADGLVAAIHLLAHQPQEGFGGGVGHAGLDAAHPARSGQGQDGVEHEAEKLLGLAVVGGERAEAVGKAAAAPALSLGAANPAPELGGLGAGQMPRKGAVGGVEEVVAFVEDQPAHGAGLLLLFIGLGGPERLVDGSLVQHQRMIGDDDVGLAGGADRLFDEAFAIMRAGGIDALAAPVGEAERAGEAVAGSPVTSLVRPMIQAGKSPPTMSPSRLASAQRAMSPASRAVRGEWVMRPNASCMLSRQT